jgi:hypothetical protein
VSRGRGFPPPGERAALLLWTGGRYTWAAPLRDGLVPVSQLDGSIRWAVPAGGGGGGSGTLNHALLTSNLAWTSSGHTGTANRIAGFGGAGAAALYQIGADLQAWDADLDALAALASTGVAVRTGSGTWTVRTITGTASEISVTDGSGVSGAPTIGIASNPTIPGTGGMVLPIGTTAQRGTSTAGRLRASTTLGVLEYYSGTGWEQVASESYVTTVSSALIAGARRLALFGGL